MKAKILLLSLCLMFAMTAQAQEAQSAQTETAEAVVNRQLAAYNAGDIDAFVATFSEDIEIFNARGELTMKGHEQLRERYDALFKRFPDQICTIENRIIINNTVIDKEKIEGRGNNRVTYAVSVNKVKDGKIVSIHFID
jgi:Uncharacterized conserved protein